MPHRALAGRPLAITGAAGFIGSRLARRLAGMGARVVGLDRRPWPAETGGLPRSVTFLRADLGNTAALEAALGGAEVIFHLAAAAGHGESMERPVADFEGNVLGTVRVLAAARELAPVARIVLASTRQVYGPAASLPVREDHPLAPPDAHAVHKEAAEHLVRHSAAQRGVPFSILRLTNTYGPGQPLTGPGAGFAGEFLRQALRGKPITILGDPGLVRDLTHVDDVVEALVRCAGPGAPSGTWNLGGPPVTLAEFAEAVFAALGEPPRLRAAPLPELLSSIGLGDFHSDWTKIRSDLGWMPRVALARGVAETVRAFRRPGT